MSENQDEKTFDERLLDILVCPLTHSKLRREGDWLIAERGGLAYPIRDSIAVMLAEEARLPEGVKSLDEFRQRLARS